MSIIDHTPSRGRYVEGCRCDGCTHANAEYHRARHKPKVLLPAEPLLAMFPDMSDDEIGEAVGVNRHTVSRWRENGLSLTVGDRIAIAMGKHPILVWGASYWSASL